MRFLDNASITTNYVWDTAKKNEFNDDLEIYFMENGVNYIVLMDFYISFYVFFVLN